MDDRIVPTDDGDDEDEDDELTDEEDAILSRIADERLAMDVTYVPCTPAAWGLSEEDLVE